MKVSRILAFRLVTANVVRLVAFYQGLGFTAGAPVPILPDEMALLGLDGGGKRFPLSLGKQRLDLDGFEQAGAAYPQDVTGADTRFQHLALVTSDVDAAWQHALALGATPMSRGGPVTLPASSGGVRAVKFRDPEGHPLEFLQFPKSQSAWTGKGLLGMDHSAISAGDAAASQSWYEAFGLTKGISSLNQGLTQAALDGLDGAVVDVLPMQPPVATPHLELLAYRAPSPRIVPHAAACDIAATRIVWATPATFPHGAGALLRDPDGHLHHLVTTKG